MAESKTASAMPLPFFFGFASFIVEHVLESNRQGVPRGIVFVTTALASQVVIDIW